MRKCRKKHVFEAPRRGVLIGRRVKRGLTFLTYGLSDGTIVLSIGGVLVKVT